MLEMLLAKGTPPKPFNYGPGSSTLVAGSSAVGFLGTITAANFTNGTAVAAACGLTGGTPWAANINVAWMKFIRNNTILYIPFLAYRYNVTWNMVYQAGAIYGASGNGAFPSGTPVPQNATIKIGNDSYKIRVLSTLPTDPNAGTGTIGGRCDNLAAFTGCEYNDLLVNLVNTWGLYTAAQVSAGWTMCKESITANPTYKYHRGYPGYGMVSGDTLAQTTVATTIVWQPVLELIQ